MSLIQKKWAVITSFVVGAILFATSLYVLIRDVHLAGFSHEAMPWFVGIMIVLSLFLMLPAQMYAAGRAIIELVGPYLPEIRIGGRRKTDPPAEEVVIRKPEID